MLIILFVIDIIWYTGKIHYSDSKAHTSVSISSEYRKQESRKRDREQTTEEVSETGTYMYVKSLHSSRVHSYSDSND